MVAGAIHTTPEWFQLDGLSSSAGIVHELPRGTRSGLDAESVTRGTFTNTQPVDGRSAIISGSRTTAYADDFYNRFHLLPRVLDFGAVSNNTSRTSVVWNAHLTPSTLNTIVEVDGEGVDLFGPSVPKTFKPLEKATVRVDIDVDGPPSISATYHFDFGARGTIALSAVGTRAKLWEFPVNWRNSLKIDYEFRTDLVTSRSGKEQRRALRTTPRRTLQFTTTASHADLRALNRVLTTWQNRTIILPDPVRKVTVTTGMPVGGDRVTVDRIYDWLSPGKSVVLVDRERKDLRVIEAISGTEIVFGTISGDAWPEGSTLHVAQEGLLNASLQSNNLTNAVAELSVSFDVTPASDAETPYEWPMDFLADREVFIHRPNWANPVSVTHAFPVEQIDFGRGRISTFRPIEFGTRTTQAAFVGQTFDEADDLRRLFERMKGRRGEFYMPTWQNDLPPKADLVAGTNFLRTAGVGAFDAYEGDMVYKAIVVLLADGRKLYRTVTQLYTVSDSDGRDTIVEVHKNWPTDIAVEDVLLVSWMPVSRFASDRLTIEWKTDSVAQVQMSVQTLESLPSEIVAPVYDEAQEWVLENWGWELTKAILVDPLQKIVNVDFPNVQRNYVDLPNGEGIEGLDEATEYLLTTNGFGLVVSEVTIAKTLDFIVNTEFPKVSENMQ